MPEEAKLQATLVAIQKDVEKLSEKVDELKEEMKTTYATKSEVALIRELVKPYIDRQKHIEFLVIGGLIAAVLKLILVP